MSYNYYMRPNDRGGGGGGRASHPEERESSRGRSRERSMDFYNGPRNQHYDQTDIYRDEMRRRNGGDGYQHRSNRSYNYNYEHHAHAPLQLHSQSWDPHSSRYPPSSRDDHYRRQERNYSSYHHKRSRSPDNNNNDRYSYQDEGFHRSRRQKTISGGESYGRRPLGSTNGAEMQLQRAATVPTRSSAHQRNDHSLMNHGASYSHRHDGVNNMSSHYHHYGRHDSSSQQASSFRPPHGQVRMQAPQFNKINDIPKLIQTAYSSLSAMSPPDTAAFWNSLAKQIGKNNQLNLTYEQMGSHIKQLFEHTRRTLETFGMKDLTQTTYSMAKLVDVLRKRRSNSPRRKDDIASLLSNLLLNNDGRIREDLFLSLANASIRKLDQFDARHMSNLAYAYALIRFVPVLADGRDLFDHIVMQSIKMRAEFDPQGISNMVWAFATVDKRHDALFKAMGDEVDAHDHLTEFEPQALSNIVWAYATAGDSHPILFEKMANHIVRLDNLGDFKPQELSNIVWAYATAGVKHPHIFEKVAKHIVNLDHFRDFHPQAISNIVWAYATAGVTHPKLFEKVGNHIVRLDHLKDFRPQALSNIVWAYATAQVSHPKMFQQVSKAAIHRNEEFISQAVANLLWSYATLGIVDKQLFSSFVPTAAKLIDSYNNQNLTNIAWAYAVAGVDAPTLFNDHFINKFKGKEDELSLEDLRQLHQWYLWQTKENSRTGLAEDLQDRCYKAFISEAPRPSKFQVDVLDQLSSIGLSPKEEVLLDSGYRIDALVEVNGKVGIEVDGPSHFIGKSKSPTGSTILKRRQVPSIDEIKLVSVPYWEWDKLGKDQAKTQKYLRELLEL